MIAQLCFNYSLKWLSNFSGLRQKQVNTIYETVIFEAMKLK